MKPSPEEQAAAFAQRKRKAYMKDYRERNREQLRQKARDKYRGRRDEGKNHDKEKDG